MTAPTTSKDYLERLGDLLPAREAKRVLADVQEIILDRVDAERERDPDIDAAEAERRALGAWDGPEELAEQLTSAPITIDLATRRTFLRALAAIFAAHLVLSILLTVAGAEGTAIPGLLGPLPTSPWTATVIAAAGMFFMDVGALMVLFTLMGKGRHARLPHLDLTNRWTRSDAVKGLILIGLLAVAFNVFLDSIFAIRSGDGLQSFLSSELKALIPFLNVVLGLFAIRHILTFVGRGERPEASAVDALACLAACGLLVMAVTRSELVRIPEGSLGDFTAKTLTDLTERLFLLVFVAAAILLAVRFVKQALRTWRLIAT